MTPLRSVCVFCGSAPGTRPTFGAAATAMGTALAGRGLALVYGGASVGLMGTVADAAVAAGGRVTGVITEALAGHEIAHRGLARLDVVRTMHQRKARMAELSDAVIMLPGGFGTFEEFFESITWVHLGLHDKPCGILNVDGYFDHLLTFVTHGVDMGFIPPQLVERITVADRVEGLLDAMAPDPASPAPEGTPSP